MDTRDKILDWPEAERLIREQLREGSEAKLVTGHFDPLLAAHSHRLAEIAGSGPRLLVVVTESEKPFLDARARVELVAALGMVSTVTAASTGLEELLRALPTANVIREEETDVRRTEEFARHVRGRSVTV